MCCLFVSLGRGKIIRTIFARRGDGPGHLPTGRDRGRPAMAAGPKFLLRRLWRLVGRVCPRRDSKFYFRAHMEKDESHSDPAHHSDAVGYDLRHGQGYCRAVQHCLGDERPCWQQNVPSHTASLFQRQTVSFVNMEINASLRPHSSAKRDVNKAKAKGRRDE